MSDKRNPTAMALLDLVVSRSVSPPSDSDPMPTAPCPQCGVEVTDYDGFGVLEHVQPAHPDGCGYCSHYSIDGGKCGICGLEGAE